MCSKVNASRDTAVGKKSNKETRETIFAAPSFPNRALCDVCCCCCCWESVKKKKGREKKGGARDRFIGTLLSADTPLATFGEKTAERVVPCSMPPREHSAGKKLRRVLYNARPTNTREGGWELLLNARRSHEAQWVSRKRQQSTLKCIPHAERGMSTITSMLSLASRSNNVTTTYYPQLTGKKQRRKNKRRSLRRSQRALKCGCTAVHYAA